MTMTEMFLEAEAKGLWFYSPYQSLWFSPAELRAARADGCFRWSPENWQLRDPQEYVADQKVRLSAAQAAYDQAIRRVEVPK